MDSEYCTVVVVHSHMIRWCDRKISRHRQVDDNFTQPVCLIQQSRGEI